MNIDKEVTDLKKRKKNSALKIKKVKHIKEQAKKQAKQKRQNIITLDMAAELKHLISGYKTPFNTWLNARRLYVNHLRFLYGSIKHVTVLYMNRRLADQHAIYEDLKKIFKWKSIPKNLRGNWYRPAVNKRTKEIQAYLRKWRINYINYGAFNWLAISVKPRSKKTHTFGKKQRTYFTQYDPLQHGGLMRDQFSEARKEK